MLYNKYGIEVINEEKLLRTLNSCLVGLVFQADECPEDDLYEEEIDDLKKTIEKIELNLGTMY